MKTFFFLCLVSLPAFAVKINVECQGDEVIVAADKFNNELKGAYICSKYLKVPVAIIKNENFDNKLDMEDSISFYVSSTYKGSRKFLKNRFESFDERFKEFQKETGEKDAYFQVDFKDLYDQTEINALLKRASDKAAGINDNSENEFFNIDGSLRKRYYDPKSARFLSEDPKGHAAGDPNFYRYVKNNPVRYVDPFGLYYERPPAEGYANQVAEGFEEYMSTYYEMLDKQFANSDQYFHCLANCRAAKAGPGGAAIANLLSVSREITQLPTDGPKACSKDMQANIAGQQAANSNQSCSQSCLGFKYNRLVTPGPWN